MTTLSAPSKSAPPSEPSRIDVWRMFDRIAHRYDFLNRALSFGLDVGWRKEAIRHLPKRSQLKILDVATGTADLALMMLEQKNVHSVMGVDLSEEMLAVGRTKLAAHPRGSYGVLKTGDAMNLPVEDQSFDAVTISFGIRNVLDVEHSLRDMRRVLKKGGRTIVLEFSNPPAGFFAFTYNIYRRYLLPNIGGIISGDAKAYKYLDETIRTFPSGEAFLQKMRNAGYINTRVVPLVFGAVSIYIGDVDTYADDEAACNAARQADEKTGMAI